MYEYESVSTKNIIKVGLLEIKVLNIKNALL